MLPRALRSRAAWAVNVTKIRVTLDRPFLIPLESLKPGMIKKYLERDYSMNNVYMGTSSLTPGPLLPANFVMF